MKKASIILIGIIVFLLALTLNVNAAENTKINIF